jgi:alpha-galactosidase
MRTTVPEVDLLVRADGGGRVELIIDGASAVLPSPVMRVQVERRLRESFEDPVRVVSGTAPRERVELSGPLAGTMLHAEWSSTRLGGEPAWELGLSLRNDGDVPVAVQRMDPIAARLAGRLWETLAFRTDWCNEFRPEWGDTAHQVRLDVRSGRSSNGTSPWLGLERDGAGIVVSPAWSGNWHIDVTDAGVLSAGIADWRFEVVLEPGQTVVAPAVVLAAGVDRDAAATALVAAIGRDWIPRTSATQRLDVEWNHWVPYEDAEIDENVIGQNAAVAARLGVGYATVDAGWFGPSEPDAYWVFHRGDWALVNAARFPSGLRALGEQIRGHGLRPGIWLDVEAVGRDAAIRRRLPGILALATDGSARDRSYSPSAEAIDPDDPAFLGYVCLGSPEGRAFVAQSLHDVVEAIGAQWLKLDFNVDPDAGCTRTDHGHGAGDGLLRHYEGLYRVLDEFRDEHPDVIVEACSSGGLRTDLGLARHVHCFFLSDPDYTEHHLQVLWGTSHLLPPSAMLHWSWSHPLSDLLPEQLVDFDALSDHEIATTLRAVMPHRLGVSLRLPELSERHLAIIGEQIELYRDVVVDLVRDGELLRLGGQPLRHGRGERFPAFQLNRGERSLVLAFRLGDAGEAGVARDVLPRRLDPSREYRVAELDGQAEPFVIRGGDPLPPVDGPGRLASRVFLIDPL